MTAPLHGPLEWRRIVQWLREDGVIAVEEAQRTVARLAQAESSQNPLVRLASVAMERATTSSVLVPIEPVEPRTVSRCFIEVL